MLDYEAADTGVSSRPYEVPLSADGGWSAGHVAAPFETRQIASLDLLIVSKQRAGFDRSAVDGLRKLLDDLATGRVGPFKFLVFDLAMVDVDESKPAAGYDDLIESLTNLIFEVPVITIAWVRQHVATSDLEFALACSMIVAEPKARFSFQTDILTSLRSYALLAHKLGFVQAERLMESGQTLEAHQMDDLLLLHSVVPAVAGFEGVQQFVRARTSRHNSACGIYRAQRIAMLGA